MYLTLLCKNRNKLFFSSRNFSFLCENKFCFSNSNNQFLLDDGTSIKSLQSVSLYGKRYKYFWNQLFSELNLFSHKDLDNYINSISSLNLKIPNFVICKLLDVILSFDIVNIYTIESLLNITFNTNQPIVDDYYIQLLSYRVMKFHNLWSIGNSKLYLLKYLNLNPQKNINVLNIYTFKRLINKLNVKLYVDLL